MELDRNPENISKDDYDEGIARGYALALRKIRGFSTFVLIAYPFLMVFMVAFLIENILALATVFALYWVMLFYLLFRRYNMDVLIRGINVEFSDYILHSPFSQSYFKFSVLPVIIFFGELVGYYVRMTAYEGGAMIIAIVAILVSVMYYNPWLRKAIRNSKPLESDSIISRLNEITTKLDIPHIIPRIIDGNTYNVANAYTVGIFRPVICITDYALDNLTEDEVLAVLTHEISHFRRRDALRMAISAFTATAAIMTTVGIMVYWSTEPAMIPYLVRTGIYFVYFWVTASMVGYIYLPSFLRWRGEIKADKLAVDYFGKDETVEALIKVHHLNMIPLFQVTPGGASLMSRIMRIKRY